jgi:predicted dehydrogenase
MKLKVAVVGAGFMGETHVASYRGLEDADVTYVCDVDASKGRPLADSAGAEYVSDFDQLLSKDLDVIDICLPTPLHRPFAVRTLESGYNLFLEKPLAIDVEEGEAIVKAADRSSGLSMVGQVVRFWPGYRELKEKVESGGIGDPRHMLCYRVGPPPGWADWYMDMGKSNGVIFDLGLHDIDFVRWVMGEPKRVYSQVFELDQVHAHGQVALDYGSGEALCECSWLGSSTFPFTTYCEVAGTEGLAHVDSRSNNSFSRFGVEVERADMYHRDGYARELGHFIRCVKGDVEPEVPLSEGLETVKLSLAAVKSAKGGGPVSLR